MKLRVAKKIVKAVCDCGPYRPGWYNTTQIEKALRIVERAYNRYSDHAMQERYGVPRIQGIIDKFHVLSKILEAAQRQFLLGAYPEDWLAQAHRRSEN